MRTIWLISIFVSVAHAGCVAVSSDQIRARDLRETVPLLRDLDPDTLLGFSPLPGTQRIFSPRQLALIGRRQGLTLTPSDGAVGSVCVERAVHAISREEMLAALLAALNIAGADLELVEFSSQLVPSGKLEFRSAGLNRPPLQAPDAPVVWRGRLLYDGQRSIMVWAKVKVSVDRPMLVAAEDIAAGAVIDPSNIKEIHERQFPLAASAMSLRADIVGKVARRPILAGQQFSTGSLDEPKDIRKGDKVRVSVIDGGTILSLDAVAESSGNKGESILVHSPSSGKSFRAVVERTGRVTVRSSPPA